jgi:hypothetical protein
MFFREFLHFAEHRRSDWMIRMRLLAVKSRVSA